MPTLDTNALLDFTDLPRWAEITPEQVAPAIHHLLQVAQQAVNTIENLSAEELTWENSIDLLNEAVEQLSRAWGVVSHLHHVIDNEAWREAYNTHLPQVSDFWTSLGQNRALMAHYQTFAQEAHRTKLTPTRAHIVRTSLRDFALSGALLEEPARSQYAALANELAQQQAKFSENLLDATNAYAYYASHDELAGLPPETLATLREAAAAEQKNGYKITLHHPSYFPVLQYADNRDLRYTLYRANLTRASELSEHPEFDNTPVMTRILSIRTQMAQLLGYDNYAQVSLAPKMAQDVAQVDAFLCQLADRARPFALQDMQQLTTFAQTELSIDTIEPWDLLYISEKLRERQYAFSEQEVKNYFPLEKCLQGLFEVIHALFGITLKPRAQISKWHPDVQYFDVFNTQQQCIGGIYLDPYARAGKNAGAWMDEVRARKKTNGSTQLPVAHMVCNFAAPSGQGEHATAATLYHDDILTLFHEAGHALHHVLTQVDDIDVSGVRGVEWDAVELPSQFMENFCWDYNVLVRMSAHCDNQEPLPRTLFDKMLAAKNVQSGMQMLRQIEFSLFDLRLHAQFKPKATEPSLEVAQINQIIDQVRQQIAVVPTASFNRFAHSFSHIFAGGYAAGYFSYKWAEVLSADVFSHFEAAQAQGAPLLNPQLGARYWQEILAVGGSRPALESFQAFMGREPNSDALLRHSGLYQR